MLLFEKQLQPYCRNLAVSLLKTELVKPRHAVHAEAVQAAVPPSSPLAVGRVKARRPSSHRHDGEVVGGHVAPLPTSRLHQTPLGVPSFVVGLQHTDGLAGSNRNFVVSSRCEVIGRKHLGERTQSQQQSAGYPVRLK